MEEQSPGLILSTTEIPCGDSYEQISNHYIKKSTIVNTKSTTLWPAHQEYQGRLDQC